MIGQKISRHLFNHSEAKLKPTVTSSQAFSCAWRRLHVFALSYDWFVRLSASVVWLDRVIALSLVLRRLDSNRFVRPRSFAHTTAGSLVCPIVFSTNQRHACTNRAGKYLIGQFSLVNNKDGGYFCGKIFCCLLNQFLSCSRLGNTSKSTRQLVQRKRCVINTASAIRKVHIFCWLSDCLSQDKLISNWSMFFKPTAFSICALAISLFASLMQDQLALSTSMGNGAAFIGDEWSEEHVNKKYRTVSIKSCPHKKSHGTCRKWTSGLYNFFFGFKYKNYKASLVACHSVRHFPWYMPLLPWYKIWICSNKPYFGLKICIGNFLLCISNIITTLNYFYSTGK